MLNPFGAPADWLDARIHYVVPLMVLFEWITLEPHGKLRRQYPLWWLAVPIAYVGYVFVMVWKGVRFGTDRVPYFFLDFGRHGWVYVCAHLILLAGLFLVMGMLMVAIDRRLGRKQKCESGQ